MHFTNCDLLFLTFQKLVYQLASTYFSINLSVTFFSVLVRMFSVTQMTSGAPIKMKKPNKAMKFGRNFHDHLDWREECYVLDKDVELLNLYSHLKQLQETGRTTEITLRLTDDCIGIVDSLKWDGKCLDILEIKTTNKHPTNPTLSRYAEQIAMYSYMLETLLIDDMIFEETYKPRKDYTLSSAVKSKLNLDPSTTALSLYGKVLLLRRLLRNGLNITAKLVFVNQTDIQQAFLKGKTFVQARQLVIPYCRGTTEKWYASRRTKLFHSQRCKGDARRMGDKLKTSSSTEHIQNSRQRKRRRPTWEDDD